MTDENEVVTYGDLMQILRHKSECLILKHTDSWLGIDRQPPLSEALEPRLAHSCRSLCRFLQHKAAGSISSSPGRDASHFPSILLGFPNNSQVLIYTPGWREALWELSVLPKNACTTQCPRPRLEPGPLAPETSIRPPRLPPSLLEIPCKILSCWILLFSNDRIDYASS